MQIGRLSNGKRRVLSVTEVTGMGDNVISTQELYRHESFATPEGEEKDRWNWLGIHPHTPKLAKMRHEARQSDGGAPEPDGGAAGSGAGGADAASPGPGGIGAGAGRGGRAAVAARQ